MLDLEYCSRSFMLQEHMLLEQLVQEYTHFLPCLNKRDPVSVFLVCGIQELDQINKSFRPEINAKQDQAKKERKKSLSHEPVLTFVAS